MCKISIAFQLNVIYNDTVTYVKFVSNKEVKGGSVI